jgi:hypothetical protein
MAHRVHTINIGGKERTLKYTLRSARELNRWLSLQNGGKAVDAIQVVNNDSIDGFSMLVCSGLKHAEPDIVPDTVLEWFEAALERHADIIREFVLPAKRALGESGALGQYFTFDENGHFTRDPAGKDGAAAV